MSAATEYLKTIGICTSCGKNQASEGRTRCAACIDYYEQRRARCKKMNLCYNCKEPLAEGDTTICGKCKAHRREYYHAVEKQRRA